MMSRRKSTQRLIPPYIFTPEQLGVLYNGENIGFDSKVFFFFIVTAIIMNHEFYTLSTNHTPAWLPTKDADDNIISPKLDLSKRENLPSFIDYTDSDSLSQLYFYMGYFDEELITNGFVIVRKLSTGSLYGNGWGLFTNGKDLL
jgi:hypothetical protein